jgi:hypothetical protein
MGKPICCVKNGEYDRPADGMRRGDIPKTRE